jgi:hypothetical protein
MVTAVSASISTPVWPVVLAVAVMVMRSSPSSNEKSTETDVSGSGWHSGMSSLVRFAPWMPAMRAVARTSAFFSPSARTSAITSGVDTNLPIAVAVRFVTALPPTSTMRALPSESRCVSPSLTVPTSPRCRRPRAG